jgi:hypothetical protein
VEFKEQVKKSETYARNQQMHFNINDVFYSQRSHQHVSTAISAIVTLKMADICG